MVVAHLERSGSDAGLLVDAVADASFCSALLDSIGRRREHQGAGNTGLQGHGRPDLRRLLTTEDLEVKLIGAEQSNTSVVFGDRVVMKLIRKVEPGRNPEVEMGAALTDARFDATGRYLGSMDYRSPAGSMTVAVAQGFVPNEGDAWSLTGDVLGRFYEHVVTADGEIDAIPDPPDPLDPEVRTPDGDTIVEIPDAVMELVGPILEPVDLLARRTAELHAVLAGVRGEAFAPEAFSTLYQRSLYQSFRGQTRSTMSLVRRRLKDRRAGFAEAVVADLQRLLEREQDLLDRFGRVRERRIDAKRIRIHGDLHLGQVLWTGRDMIIIDFEGEPSRAIGERRIKRSPLVDVAGVLRSFRYATIVSLAEQAARGVVSEDPAQRAGVEAWGDLWRRWVDAIFLARYLDSLGESDLLPSSSADLRLLLDAYEMEKAIYELRYELQYRPAWVQIPLGSILSRLDEESGG